MKEFITICLLVVCGCQYSGDMSIYYLVDGGSSDGGLSDGSADTDSDIDSDDPDGGMPDAGPECMAGPCCDNEGYFYQPEDLVVCDTAILYRCIGTCGNSQVEQMLDARKHCDGSSDSCTGLWTGTWEVWEPCEASFACEISLFGFEGDCMYCPSGCDMITGFCNP